ncbi:unnamed protein product [Parajaminaea phylloscopi]
MQPTVTSLLRVLFLLLGSAHLATALPEVRSNSGGAYLPALNAPSQGRQAEHSASGKNGVVSSEVDVCSNVGADILKQGGSAADAVIAAGLCVGTIDSFHSGIGGGGHILVHDGKTKKAYHIDMREVLPAAGYENIFKDHGANSSVLGGLAVGVPGEIRGWEALHKRWGKLSWKKVFDPAVKINFGGFKVPNQLATAIRENKDYVCKGYFEESYCPKGKIAVEGQTISRPRYGKALAKIGKEGPNAFYTGDIARSTIKAIKSSGGIMTLADLRNYTVVHREPVTVQFNNHTLYAASAPASGAVVLSALQTLDQFDDLSSAGYNLTTHRFIEATKFAYGERASFGDPAFIRNVSRLQHDYLQLDYAKEKRSKIKDSGVLATTDYEPSRFEILNDAGTSHLVAIDSHGLAVTLTTTVNTFFGSKVMTSDGIVLNNQMDDFSTPGESNTYGYVPTVPNFPAPGKRPLSSIAPLVAVDSKGHLVLATGSAGGSRIPTAVMITTFGVLQDGLDVQSAIRRPRWHDQLSPATTYLEWEGPADGITEKQAVGAKTWHGFNNGTAAFLKSVGHNITYVAPGSSTVQGSQFFPKNGTFLGGAEIRQLSAAAAAV